MDRTVLSYPKCGRTWVRLFFHYYLDLIGEEDNIIFTHKEEDAIGRRIVLIRDPRDVMVSAYMHYKYRKKRGKSRKTISSFIRHPKYGVKNYRDDIEQWFAHKDNLVVCYENLFNFVWGELVVYFGYPVHLLAMIDADNKCSFKNLRKHMDELEQMEKAWRYIPKIDHPESHKIRRGVVGGYVDYLDDSDIKYINAVMGNRRTELCGICQY